MDGIDWSLCEACIQTQETFYWLLMVKVNHHFFLRWAFVLEGQV